MEYTVSEFSKVLGDLLKTNFGNKLLINGQIANCKVSGSNCYFNLKDEESTINCVIFRYNKELGLENGQNVCVTGGLTIFKKTGTYNINVSNIDFLDIEDNQSNYEKIKSEYEKKGYFVQDRKKKLPKQINSIGILTSASGAALQDVLYVLNKNNYGGQIYVKDCFVQGAKCVNSVINGLDILDSMNLDVILMTRGGGSFEELSGFSQPEVLEKIYTLKTCIVSAIGHEVDFMLSDFVSDVRAPTPSVAAELLSSSNLTIEQLSDQIKYILRIIIGKINNYEYNIQSLLSTVKSKTQILIDHENKLNGQIYAILNLIHSKISHYENVLEKLDISNKTIEIVNNTKLFINNDVQIDSIEGFKKMIKKKMKIVFKDGTVSFNIRSIEYGKGIE